MRLIRCPFAEWATASVPTDVTLMDQKVGQIVRHANAQNDPF